MSRIDELLRQHCPNGVEFRRLGEIMAPKFGTRITKLKDSGTKFPVYGGGGESFRTDEFNREDDYVISRFAMSERCVRLVRGKFWMLDSGFTFDPIGVDIEKSFLAEWLLNSQREVFACSSQGAQKNLRTTEFLKFRVPVPPLSVQREIVHVLHLFQSLDAELEAELEARARQYAHYRALLMTLPDEVPRVPMGDIGEIFRGKRFTKQDYVSEGIGAIHYGELYTHYGVAASQAVTHVREEMAANLRFARPGDVIIAEVGETVEDVGKATAWLGNASVAIHDGCYGFRHSMNPKFIAYYMQTADFHVQKNPHVARAKVKRLSLIGLKQVRIPVPSLPVQDRIVAVLDAFDELVNDLSVGLPAELSARRQQYEYYRDRLLRFEEAV